MTYNEPMVIIPLSEYERLIKIAKQVTHDVDGKLLDKIDYDGWGNPRQESKNVHVREIDDVPF